MYTLEHKTSLIISICFLAIACNNSNSSKEEKWQEASSVVNYIDSIISPFPALDQSFVDFTYMPANENVFEYERTGTKITIAANSLVDTNGISVNKPIKIKYREFRSPSEIFLSGIPMTYDSLNQSYVFESDGMFEIKGECEGSPVFIKDNSMIKIELKTNDKSQFNFYELESTTQKWKFKNVNTAKVLQKIKSFNKKNSDNKKPEITLILPEPISSGAYTFTIKYNLKEYPELSAYENVKFQVNQSNFNSKLYKVKWDNITLLSSNDPGNYIVKLEKGDTTINVKAKPVFDKADYELAKKQFDVFSAKNDQAEMRKTQERKEANQQITDSRSKQEARMVLTQVLQINNFGIFNCDRLLKPGNTISVDPIYVSNDHKPIKLKEVFLCQSNINGIFTFDAHDQIKFNQNESNILWGKTKDGMIAFFDHYRFGDLDGKKEKQMLEMEIMQPQLAIEKINSFVQSWDKGLYPN